MSGPVTLGSATSSAFLRIYDADALSAMQFTGDITLGNNATIQASGGGTTGYQTVLIDSKIGDGSSGYGINFNGDSTWGSTNYQTIRVTGASTYTGAVTLSAGTLEFTTVTNAGAGASSLGNGPSMTLGSATLRFVGGTSQSTDRPITQTGSTTYSANGTSGATISYTGAINAGGNAVTLVGTAEGYITGGITQTSNTADINVNSGTWHLGGSTPSALADDVIVTGTSTGTAVLNLDTTGVLSYLAGNTGNGLYVRDGGVVNLNANDVNGAANSGGLDYIILADTPSGAAVTLNTNTFNITTPRLDLGSTVTGRTADVTGTGTVTVTYAGTDYLSGIRLFDGAITANLAGVSAMLKQGLADVTLSGNNSGLTGTVAATRIDSGNLILDFTSDNNAKISSTAALDLRGSTLTVNGNASAPTSQTVASLTLGNGGASIIDVNGGTGQTAVLNLNAITRAVNSTDGTLRFILPDGIQSASNGITTDSTNNVSGTYGILGGWATVKDSTGTYFAMNATNAADGNIVAATTALKDDVTSWLTGENVSDSSGFTGTLGCANINSLRFNAGSGSDLVIAPAEELTIASGGILVTDQVGGTPSISGGTLTSGAMASGVPELMITQDSSQTFEISSAIRINTAIVKSGTGTLLLSGTNPYTGTTDIQAGTLQVSGGNAIGDTSLVTLADDRPSMLQLLSNETIGRLAGGNATTGLDQQAVVDVGSHTLTINQTSTSAAAYAGLITGSGTIIKNGAGNEQLTNVSSGFTGSIVINGGLLYFSNLGTSNASSITLNHGSFLIDNNGTTSQGTHVADTATINLNSADAPWSGTTIASGLSIRRDQGSTQNETVGLLNVNSGASYTRLEASVGSAVTALITDNILRSNNATLDVRGTNMSATSGQRAQLRIGTTANQTTFMNNMIGGGSVTLGTKNISIVPWAIAEEVTGTVADGNMGNSLATYVSGQGFRALNLSTEYATYTTAGTQDNTRESLSADLTGLAGKTINSLVINNAATASINVTGLGSGETLTNTSGAFLFTVSGGAASTAYSTTLSGFDGGIKVGGSEYLFYVVNPSSAATTSTLSTTIGSPLLTAADITKSGRGTLILTAVNTAGGGSNKTTLNEGVLEISDLDNIGGNSGALYFAGGTLRLSSTYTGDDFSQRPITIFAGGATLDTNSNNLTLASSLGAGTGGFTKIGAGTLTLNAGATFTGPVTVSAGSIVVGANNALGIGGDLTITAGATLDVGVSTLTQGLVTTSGSNPVILGTGTINASTGFFFNNTDTAGTTVNAVLGGTGGLLKAQSNVLTLTGASTYTGITEVQAGTLAFTSISNVGAGPSSLGNPTDADTAQIRMGLTTTATTLNYTGAGSTSDRIVAMQGTTGNVTVDADGTGALTLGGAHMITAGNKSLILRGSSDPALVNQIGAIEECGLGVLTLNKTDSNTWMINAASSYTGVTQIDNGSLQIGVDDALPIATTVRLGTGSTAGTLDLNGYDQTIASLLCQTNSATAVNNLIVDAGNTLTVNGAVTLGVNAAASTTLFTASGGGAFVNNNDGGTFQVGGATGSTNVNATTADFSGLSSFTANLGTTGIFRVGDNNTNSSGGPSASSTLILASTANTITAGTVNLGQGTGQGSSVQTLSLGAGTNVINADTINIGGNTTRSGGAINFADSTGTVTIRGSDGVSATDINMVNGNISTGYDQTSQLLLAGHYADILADTMTMASRSASTGSVTSTFTFNEGILDVTTLTMASRSSTGTGGATATVTIGGGTTTIDTLNMALNTSAGGAVSATFNVTAGDVTLGTGTGTAVNMADAISGRTVTSSINLTGGTTTVDGSIIRTGAAGTENASITLAGGTLDMSGNVIGSSTAPITLNAQSGVLENLAELNGGGALTKTTAGTLILQGDNTYTGPTAINGGILQVNSASALDGTGTISFGGGTLQYTANNQIDYSSRFSTASSQAVSIDTNGQDVTFATALTSTGGTLTKSGTGTLELTAASTYDGTTTVTDGTLLANNSTGSATGTGTVSITGGALGGIGAVAGATTVSGTGSITPGTPDTASGVGTLTFGGDLTLSGAATPTTRLALDLGLADATTFNDADNIAAHIAANDLASYFATSGTLSAYEAETGTHDRLSITGALNLDSNGLIVVSTLGYAPKFGDVFDLLDWGSITFNADAAGASFDVATDLMLPSLSSGLAYDTSLFTTQGIVVIVPEPSKAVLLLIGLCATTLRRRRTVLHAPLG